ncbi:hypothetical protein CTAYLR_001151 [Chrysophaeum taylorii]|uniref:FAD-binding domain-containing protein n=1 Tax=Chrysophaeum taylorii TaxID=2483200 RepID=A0AAD7UQL3_9STRA|nr:hypothetical protein CTAYLR_001151 [Chrysophaeum taylorii]
MVIFFLVVVVARALVVPPQSWSTKEGPASTIIVGAGPAGLASAIVAARRGWKQVRVIDRRPPPEDVEDESVWLDASRHYLIGLGGRGQLSLAALDAWDSVERYSSIVVGRKDWAPGAEGVERIYYERPYKTQVIARDRLAGVLYRLAREKFPDIDFGFETSVEGARVTESGVFLDTNRGPLEARFVVAADGAARTIATEIEKLGSCKVVRYRDDNERVFKTVPLSLPPAWKRTLNYSARSRDGRVNFDALPATRTGDYNGVLLLRARDPVAQKDGDPYELRALLDQNLPQFSPLVSDETLYAVARSPANPLPRFRFVDKALHHEDKVVILGDAAHTVKPYFGLGANTAFQDVVELDRALNESETGDLALANFTRARAPEAKAIVQISRSLDRPGIAGLFSFIFPIILDGYFHKLFPKLFATNAIAMMQRLDVTFQGVRRRKRLDRAVQVALLLGVFALLKPLFSAMAPALGRATHYLVRQAPVTEPICLAAVLYLAFRYVFLGQGRPPPRDPADLLARSAQKITEAGSESLKIDKQPPE